YDATSGAKIINCTITNNTASYGAGAGVYSYSGTILLNTIVAGNVSNKDISGTFSSASYFNVIGYDSNLSNGINNGDNVNVVGGESGAAAVNVHLSTLGYHGGTTKTHVPLSTSPVIDRGGNSLLYDIFADLDFEFLDQRGSRRFANWHNY